ncbi:hypothetical protein LCGC14_1331010 [marine sediment metagenome]|uniref:Uncharacterized protein n=1 Tax=marine sediment metagenome TaxID=412755 RepID=A0A0F9NJ37_9ZZZZ
MRYDPVNHTCKELVIKRGFTPAKHGMGYERVLNIKAYDRLHALIHYDYIDLHVDKKIGDKQHETRRFSKMVLKEIYHLMREDVGEEVARKKIKKQYIEKLQITRPKAYKELMREKRDKLISKIIAIVLAVLFTLYMFY